MILKTVLQSILEKIDGVLASLFLEGAPVRVRTDDEYRKSATCASILYPVICLWAALLEDSMLYNNVMIMKRELMQHCTFQFWYPDEQSEMHFYKNDSVHGATLANIDLDISPEEFIIQVFRECEETQHFQDLSAVKYDWWPLIVVACRHYRLPMPLHLLYGFRKLSTEDGVKEEGTSILASDT